MKRLTLLMLLPLALFSSCNSKNKLDDRTIVIGCSPTPHAEILKEAKPLIEEKGYKLDIKVIQDYVTPNTLLAAGDLDANYFQHVPYLTDFNEKNHTEIEWIAKIHFEPMGIYSKKWSKVNDLDIPNNAKIAVPNDKSNYDRAVALLISNSCYYNLIEMEAQAIPAALDDVDFAVINGNYALSANVTRFCLATESSDSDTAIKNANVIAVVKKSIDNNYAWISVLEDVMLSDKMRTVINTKFGSAVKAVF